MDLIMYSMVVMFLHNSGAVLIKSPRAVRFAFYVALKLWYHGVEPYLSHGQWLKYMNYGATLKFAPFIQVIIAVF